MASEFDGWPPEAYEAEIARLRAALETAEQREGNLLAVIHGDGGHHMARVGVDQSSIDAAKKWYDAKAALDTAERDRDSERAGLAV